ncbi:MAG: class I SAM-dependent methyltransferase [Catenulispora sp.]|nr:class I SAM-dependent methyltransferase [Catenulispora sp.]
METHHLPPPRFAGAPPWEIGRPQPALTALAESGGFSGRVLETGCGSGENGLMLAALGLRVVGLDVDAAALEQAGRKARERGLDARAAFRRFDIRELAELGEMFDTAVDSLLFHALDAETRRNYVAGLHSVLRPGGRLYVLCYSDRHVGPPDVPHKVSLKDIRAAFAGGWSLDEVLATSSASNVHPDGVAAWLITCTRR